MMVVEVKGLSLFYCHFFTRCQQSRGEESCLCLMNGFQLAELVDVVGGPCLSMLSHWAFPKHQQVDQ